MKNAMNRAVRGSGIRPLVLALVLAAVLPGALALRRATGQPVPPTPEPAPDGARAAAAAAGRLCPGPLLIRVKTAPEGKPAAGFLLRLGGRFMTTTPAGEAIFDGVPDGEYRLSIHVLGFNRLDQTLALPPGTRAPVELLLEPEQRATVPGRVTVRDLGVPLAGARVVLTPVAVAAAVTGPLECRTDWAGNFTILQLPVGSYRADVRAAGCRNLVVDVQIAADGKTQEFTLERDFSPARLQLQVADALNGGPVAGAEVVLAEAFPWGEIARARTGADGVAAFADLKLGQVNWSDAQGKCALARRHVTVHVEAPGYAPMTDPVTLGPDAAATVQLHPVRDVTEGEPNDEIGSAQEIDLGAVVTFTLPKTTDHDWFKFRLPHAGRLVVTIGPANPLQTFVQVFNPQGICFVESAAHAGQANVIDRQVGAGEYRVHVTEWYNDASGDAPLTLKLGYTPVPDPLQPNETPAAARLMRVNEEARGYQHPVGDTDCYRFEVKRPCAVKVSLPPSTFQRCVRVLDQALAVRAEGAAHAAQPLAIYANLLPGAYVIEVSEWYRDDCSLDPYAVRIEIIEDDGIDDTPARPGPPAWGRALAANGFVGNTIFPLGDVDYYLVPLPGPGVFRAGAAAVHQTALRVLARNGGLLTQAAAHANTALGIEYHADQAQTVFLEVTEWYSDDAVPSPYALWTSFAPCDEQDAAGRNDTPDTATPFEPGETLRGTILPIRDVDTYRFAVDRPGWFDAATASATQLFCRVRDAQQRSLGEWAYHAGTPGSFSLPLLPGEYTLEVHEWYDDDWSPSPHEIRTAFRRADPEERAPLVNDPVRALGLGEAQPFKIEHRGDRERFRVDLPAAGKYVVSTEAPFQRFVTGTDALANTALFQYAVHAGAHHDQEFAVKGPTRLLLDVTEWYNDDCSMEDGYVLVAPPGKAIVAERLVATLDRTDPTRVSFRREESKPYRMAVRALLDADGDGRPDLELPASGAVEYRYAAQGVYNARALLEGADGVRGLARTWVEAVGHRERKGVHLLVNFPRPNDVIETDEPLRASAISYSGAKIARVDAAIDGRPVGAIQTTPYELAVPWDTLGPGEHTLAVTATDRKGEHATLERKFSVSEFFDLVPRDGAQVTGQAVAVSWRGRSFGPAAVRLRKAGASDWAATVPGESARARRLSLADLEPGVAYEFSPVGAADGPIRTVTRVKGLAFGRTNYAATIPRDYDQKLGVSVRNHGKKPLTVRLECGAPPDASKLLVGFVGEGSAGAPFELAPGEEREFLLGLSAQDCVAPKVAFPIRLVALDSGISDEAQVEVDVRLPRVELVWETKGELPGGIGKLLVLKNAGDTLTDLAVGSASTDLGINPSVSHGMFPAGASMEFRMVPRLYEGFQSAAGRVVAQAVNQVSASEQTVALKEGERIHAVDLRPRSGDPETDDLRRERALAAAYMSPASVDWSQKTNPQDADGDGKIDRWFVDIPYESTRWIGNDTDGDGEIDSAQADIGPDGCVDFAALKGPKGWEETNLVDAHLEMGFKLPWARSAYEKHDADIVMNDAVVGKLRDTIPEGNYTFRIPPAAFRFNEDGSPGPNAVRIKSKHLRGGHYVVSSDFRMKLKLTGTRVYTAAKSQAEAEQAVRATPGLVLDAPDLSISSEEMRVVGEPKSGSPLTVTVPLRNLGAGPARQVEVALRFSAGGEEIELARTALAEVPPSSDSVPLEITAPAPAGDVLLKLVLDPEKKTADTDRDNNEASAPFKAAGDTVKPTLAVTAPAEGASLAEPVVKIAAQATDDAGVARVDVRVDQGLWTRLGRGGAGGGFACTALLQPGAHRLTVRVLDTSGNLAEKTVNVAVTAPAPTVEIVEPAEGAKLDARAAEVVAQCGAGVVRVAARVNGGPWQPGALAGTQARIPLPLAFGAATIEVMAVDQLGMRKTATRRVECTKQATAEEEEAAGAPPAGAGGKAEPLDVPGLGPVDPNGPDNPVRADADASTGGAAAAPDAPGTEAGPVATPEASAEAADVPDDPGEDGNYGAEPPEGADPAALEGLDEAEAAMDQAEAADAAEDGEELDPEQWLNDPDVDTTEDPELADPEVAADPDYQPPDMESWDEMPPPEEDLPQGADGGPAGDGGGGGGGGGFPPLPPLGDAGGYVGVQQRQSDWYCTNRPEIEAKFQMPDELKKLKIPKPGTKEFAEAFAKRLAALKAQGVDTSQLEKLRQILQNRCNRVDSPAELPSFLQSLGIEFGYKAKPNPAELAEWREKLAGATDSFMLRLLHSNNSALIAEGLKARMGALGQFDTAAKESAEAALETVKANQQLTQDIASAIPYVNIAVSAHSLLTGESLTGEKLGKLDTVMHILTLAGPASSLFKNPTLRGAAAGIGNKALWVGEKTIGKLAGKLGLTPARLKGALNSMSDVLGKARIKAGEKLYGKVWAEGQRFLQSPAGRKAAQQAAKDVAQAESLLHRIAQARAAGDKNAYRRLIGSLQGNKTAQGLLNSPKYSNAFRAALDKTHRAMGRLTDQRTIADLMKNPKVQKEIEALAKKLGVPAKDILIKARNVSGNVKTLKNVKPGELLKYGADRDVVFQYGVKSRYGFFKSAKDVHHKLVEKTYAQHLRAISGRKLAEMDHVVTSRWHPEAYNAGLNPNTQAGRDAINGIISGKAVGTLKRPADIRATIIHKGKEWMEAGRKSAARGRPTLGNQKIKEGMRQMTKEFDRQVAQFLQAKGLTPARALPPRLRQGMEIFKQVQKGMTVEQAEAMLKAMTPKGGVPVTPETIVEDLGHFVEFVNKWGLKAGA
ncbi:MAG: carboxypeptidase regulatory-like domain-containing protein [Planctomycetes bacterium]|nr:carboxypeptidase regulatory-like domain-containing protein [Planctomycetota bacterium]